MSGPRSYDHIPKISKLSPGRRLKGGFQTETDRNFAKISCNKTSEILRKFREISVESLGGMMI